MKQDHLIKSLRQLTLHCVTPGINTDFESEIKTDTFQSQLKVACLFIRITPILTMNPFERRAIHDSFKTPNKHNYSDSQQKSAVEYLWNRNGLKHKTRSLQKLSCILFNTYNSINNTGYIHIAIFDISMGGFRL